jgi:hypothetical protein
LIPSAASTAHSAPRRPGSFSIKIEIWSTICIWTNIEAGDIVATRDRDLMTLLILLVGLAVLGLIVLLSGD